MCVIVVFVGVTSHAPGHRSHNRRQMMFSLNWKHHLIIVEFPCFNASLVNPVLVSTVIQ